MLSLEMKWQSGASPGLTCNGILAGWKSDVSRWHTASTSLEAPLGLLSYSWSSLTHLVAGTAHSLPARAASISRAVNGYRGPDISCVREDASSSYSTAQLPPASIEALKEWISFPLAPADCGCRDPGVVFRPRAPGRRHRSSPQASTPTHHLNL